MRMSQLLAKTIKENPRDAELASHRFLVRAGYVRRYSAGVYGLLPLAQRSVQKIEQIVREEMNAICGQEVKMPCLMTKELWDESGRYSSIDQAMYRFPDRSGQGMLLGMTHEEASVFLARTELNSYKQLPFMIYQIQTKFRDEPRARGGLIRLREFMMKDAYSFHASEDDLQSYYEKVHAAYMRIFTRCGCPEFVSVLSDNGMFGGKFSHEFMLLTPSGEDTLITCTSCNYKANQEIATAKLTPPSHPEKIQALTKVATPGKKTIQELAEFMGVETRQTAKAVLFEDSQQKGVVAFVRGDRNVVEAKLQALLRDNIVPATAQTIGRIGACAGSTGPIGLDLQQTRVVIDPSAMIAEPLIIGANENDMHWQGFNFKRDFLDQVPDEEKSQVQIADIMQVEKQDPCPQCGADLTESRGIEIGNIFHLGDRYTQTMKCTFLDENGRDQHPIMGCYGLGISRLLPAIVEESHDERGMILPMAIAPFQVHLIALNYHKDQDVRALTDRLYQEMIDKGIEVLCDDRKAKAGPQFADADLMGIPIRLTVSRKTVQDDSVEWHYRDGRQPAFVQATAGLIGKLKQSIAEDRGLSTNV